MLFIIPIVIGLLFRNLLSHKNTTILIGVMYTALAALRSVEVGYDTMTYSHRFISCGNMSIGDILSTFSDEPAFYLLCKFIHLIGGDFQILLLVIGAVSMFSAGRLALLYSPSIVLSFAMLIPLQYYGFMLSAERQTLAISTILLGVPFIFNRQFVKYLVIVAIAYSFHNSALLAFPLYFCYIDKLDNKKRALALLLIPILYASKSILLNYGLSFMYSEYSAYEEEQGSYATLLLYCAFWGLYTTTKKTDTNKIHNFFEAAAIIGIIIQLYVPLEPNIFRLAFYYQIFNIVLLPIALSNIKNDALKNIGYVTTYVVLLLMYFMFTYNANGVNPYTFFWEA